MRVRNDADDPATGAFAEVIRLQSEFYTRLTEETLKYLRRLQVTAAPASPGTVVMPSKGASLESAGAPGEAITLQVEIENRQRVYCVVTPMLSPLAHASGTTWFPSADFDRPSLLIAPEQVETIAVKIPVPAEIPEGTFRGTLLLQGFRENAIPVALHISAAKSVSPPSGNPMKAARTPKVRPVKRRGKK
jgi:hypothetical protein